MLYICRSVFFMQERITCWGKSTPVPLHLLSLFYLLPQTWTESWPFHLTLALWQAQKPAHNVFYSKHCVFQIHWGETTACSQPELSNNPCSTDSQHVLSVHALGKPVPGRCDKKQDMIHNSWLSCMTPKTTCGICRKSQTSLIGIA